MSTITDQEAFFNPNVQNEEEEDVAFPNPNVNNPVGGEGSANTGHNHRRSSLTEAINEALNREDVQSWIAPYLSIFTLHGGVGFVAGMAAKKMGSTALKYVVTGAVCLQVCILWYFSMIRMRIFQKFHIVLIWF